MNTHHPTPREALRALGQFLAECSRDRTREERPLRNLVLTLGVHEFSEGLEKLMRALLVDYSLELRSQMVREALQRSVRRHFLH